MNNQTYNFVINCGTRPTETHARVSLEYVEKLLVELKRNKFNHKHELRTSDHELITTGYSHIRDYINSCYAVHNKVETQVNNFVIKINAVEIIGKIQKLASTPGNEDKILELSSVLKYAMTQSEVPPVQEEHSRSPTPERQNRYKIEYQNDLCVTSTRVYAPNLEAALLIFKKDMGYQVHSVYRIE